MGAHVVHHRGDLRIAQVHREPIAAAGRGLAESGHAVAAAEHGERRVLPGNQRGVAGEPRIMSGADGTRAPGHVTALADVRIDLLAAELPE